MLTERGICERFARVQNLEESPDVLCELLHIEAKWVTKWWTGRLIEIQEELRLRRASSQRDGLCFVELVSGHPTEDGGFAHCTATVPIARPDTHSTRTYFRTDGRRITRMFTYAEWLDPTWPYPERLDDKLAELMCKDVPIAPVEPKAEPPKLAWPDDGRNPEDAGAWQRQDDLAAVREAMAQALDADPQGAPIPDLGLK